MPGSLPNSGIVAADLVCDYCGKSMEKGAHIECAVAYRKEHHLVGKEPEAVNPDDVLYPELLIPEQVDHLDPTVEAEAKKIREEGFTFTDKGRLKRPVTMKPWSEHEYRRRAGELHTEHAQGFYDCRSVVIHNGRKVSDESST